MELDTKMIQCFACCALVPDIDGPTHKYMLSAPGCWKLYGEILAKEYSPENCKWDTRPNQNRNRRSNVYIEYNGLNLCIQDWAILLNTKFMNIKNALVRGKTFDYIYNKYKKNENDNL